MHSPDEEVRAPPADAVKVTVPNESNEPLITPCTWSFLNRLSRSASVPDERDEGEFLPSPRIRGPVARRLEHLFFMRY